MRAGAVPHRQKPRPHRAKLHDCLFGGLDAPFGGRRLAGTLSGLLAGASMSEAGTKVVEREIKYFEKHSGHMDYGKRREQGVPIGGGSVASLCGQFQDRLKRRG